MDCRTSGNVCQGGRRAPRSWRRRALVAAIIGSLAACNGDGLYDPPENRPDPDPVPPPPGTARGQLYTIPGTGALADLVVDAARQRVFLSNRGEHRVEVFALDALAFGDAVRVGSQPWGMALNPARDTLIVANSGGTNISFVDLATLTENPAARFDIPRVVLYEYEVQVDTVKKTVGVKLSYHNFADRPRHVAQDAQRRLIYSALSTAAAPIGTLRVAELRSGWATWDARLLFVDGSVASNPAGEHRAVTQADSVTAIANLDSMTLVWREVNGVRALTQNVVMFDHRPGTRPGDAGRLIRSDTLPFLDAFLQMRARGSDVIIYPNHRWNLTDSNATADTTFVAASADHRWVAIGEMPKESAGRVLLWGAGTPGADGALARVEDARDIMNNTADRMLGIALNDNGTLGVARGTAGSYFFGSDLRLQGLAPMAPGGGSGTGFVPGSTTNRTFAVEPTGARGVRVIETTHYRVVSEIPVGETVTGPFRVGPARAGAAACPADFLSGPPDCVVATAYGVTAGRRLLVLDILRRDVAP